ncbi:aspartate aminotransferase family protein [Niveispirillum sp. BGYR6]|uniref:aspartate aminotransferase family protein n=1 Tax=Niveispirillum sp. BGYR6 TaxID=2971249 RepID=UPI0022B9A3DD|nr:aspartate aminotransferase family protein [Niveispirillum sp. BGYR6]MDG5497503.1 aspartate aminotransferase family protein [Niveispirillum sp. BGYR6]
MSADINQSQDLLTRRQKVMAPSYRLFYEEPVEVVRAEGVWLYGPQGERYLDFYNNVPVVGHSHPYVVERLHAQALTLNTHTRYLTAPPVELAERLLATMPSALGSVIFTCTGSEANDLAIRMSRFATGRRGVIVTDAAYHGTSDLLSGMSPVTGLPTGPDVYTIHMPEAFDRPEQFGDLVQGAIARMKADGVAPAALLVDTIFGSDGVVADPAGFLASGVAAIHAAGGLFIADEVQPGFGRTGEGMWGFQRHGVVPDIVTMGKPMGNGHPVASLVTKREIADEFVRYQRYFNTFGGNTVSCAVALAVLDVIEREQLIAHAAEVGAQLKAGLQALAQRHPIMQNVRGAGLFMSATMASGSVAGRVLNSLRRKGVLIGLAGRGNVSLKIRPPLVITKDEVTYLLDALDQVLATEA